MNDRFAAYSIMINENYNFELSVTTMTIIGHDNDIIHLVSKT